MPAPLPFSWFSGTIFRKLLHSVACEHLEQGIGGGSLKNLYTTKLKNGPLLSKSLPLGSPPPKTFLQPFQP